jgi:hypothetical protein
MKYVLTHTHIHTHTLTTYTLSFSFSFTHTHTQTQTNIHTHTHTNTRINKNTHIRKHTMPLVFFNVAQQGPAGGTLRTKLSNELVKSKVQIPDVQDWLKVWCYEIFLSS